MACQKEISMRWKSLPILFLIFLGLFFYIIIFDKNLPDSITKRKTEKRLIHLRSENIDQMTIQNRFGRFFLKKDSGLWHLCQPITVRANIDRVNSILNEILFAEYIREVPEKISLKEIGLANPVAEVTLNSQTQSVTIKIGKDTAIGSNLYLMVDKLVYVVDKMILEEVNVGIEGLRTKKIVPKISFPIDKITISRDKIDIIIEKKNDWMITSPIKRIADPKRIDQIIKTFKNLKILDYMDDLSDIGRYGVSKPTLTVRLSGGKDGVAIFVGCSYLNDRVYLKNSLEQNIYGVEAKSLNLFRSSLFELSRKQIFLFDENSIKKISISSQLENFVIGYKNDEWQIDKPIKAKSDSAKISLFLNSLKNIEVLKFVNDKNLTDGLPEEFSLEITSDDETIFCKFYLKNNLYYLLLNDDRLFQITAPKIPKKMIYFASFDFIKTNKYSLIKLSLTDGVKKNSIRKQDDMWFLGKTVLSDTQCDKLLSAVKNIKPEKIISTVTENKLRQYGLFDPDKTLDLSFDEQTGYRHIAIDFGVSENGYIYAVKRKYPLIFTIKKSALDEIENILSLH